jgi:hypothetical protein
MKLQRLFSLAFALTMACTADDPSPPPDDSHWPDAACTTYCDTVLASCGTVTGTDGGNAQYLSKAGCMAQCSTMVVGKASDRDVDTVGCRLYHAEQAAQDTTQCRAAGSNGGGVCGTNRCEVFCKQAVTRCTASYTSLVPFASYDACMSTCSGEFTFNPAKPEVYFQGPDLNCRIAHLVAANDPGTGFGPPPDHCWHIDRIGTGGFCAPASR